MSSQGPEYKAQLEIIKEQLSQHQLKLGESSIDNFKDAKEIMVCLSDLEHSDVAPSVKQRCAQVHNEFITLSSALAADCIAENAAKVYNMIKYVRSQAGDSRMNLNFVLGYALNSENFSLTEDSLLKALRADQFVLESLKVDNPLLDKTIKAVDKLTQTHISDPVSIAFREHVIAEMLFEQLQAEVGFYHSGRVGMTQIEEQTKERLGKLYQDANEQRMNAVNNFNEHVNSLVTSIDKAMRPAEEASAPEQTNSPEQVQLAKQEKGSSFASTRKVIAHVAGQAKKIQESIKGSNKENPDKPSGKVGRKR